MAEYSTGQPTGSGTSYLTADPLGTPRVITGEEQSQLVKSRHDYLPFGEEITANVNGRTPQQGYVVDNLRQKFTAKERDTETGLDYFLARYYSSVQGRFTSPDEFEGGPDELFDFADDAADNPTFYADLSNPQSLNKYQYVYNNPLALTDPDGHCPICAGAAAAGGVGIVILLSADTTHAPGPNDRHLAPSGDGQIAAVNAGAAEAIGGPILSKLGSALSRTGSKIISRVTGKAAAEEGATVAAKVAIEGGGGASKAIHKNSLEYVGETHVYRIKGPDGKTFKIGESARGVRKTDGKSIRAESQVRALIRQRGPGYSSEIRKVFKNKAAGRDYERRVITRFRRRYGPGSLPGNKSYH